MENMPIIKESPISKPGPQMVQEFFPVA